MPTNCLKKKLRLPVWMVVMPAVAILLWLAR
jgi:hypothetical protein